MKNEIKTVEEKKFECPLCKSTLTKSRYYEIVGVWEEKKKFENELKKKIDLVKNKQAKLIKEKENIKKKYELQKRAAIEKAIRQAKLSEKKLAQREITILKRTNLKVLMGQKKEKVELIKQKKKEISEAKKIALAEGKQKEKKRADTLSTMLQKKMTNINDLTKTIKELKEQLKKGSTPQLEGLNFEHELIKELKLKFPHDKIEHHGQAGDILHYIICEGKEIALIVYECKKTQKFSKSYITQIKNDVIKRNANYGILVTFAQAKNKSQFWVEKDILIVHPYGAPYIAEILRNSLIQLYSLKLSDKELSERAKNLLEYIKSNKFRNSVKDNITRAKELYELLNKEVEYHKTCWKKRHEHYTSIAKQSQQMEEDSKKIVGEDLGQEQKEPVLIQMEMKPKKKRKTELLTEQS